MERVLIIGAGPQARMIPDVLADCGNIELLGFVDVADEKRFLVGNAADFPVYERSQFPAELKSKLADFSVLIAGGLRGLRLEIIEEVEVAGLSFVNVIHPSAIIASSARIGQDVLILPGVIIGSGVTIGDHIILNSAVTIDHDSLIEDNVSIGAGVHLAGGITVRSGSFIGIGACSANGATIGRNCLIGAGTVITEDIPDNVVAAGVPAKIIRSRS